MVAPTRVFLLSPARCGSTRAQQLVRSSTELGLALQSDITFGENTGNEMCFNFATYYPMGAMNCGGLGGTRGGFMF